MGFLSLFHSGSNAVATPQVIQPGSHLTKFFNINNTPVSNFCQTVPITQPSLISTTFGTTLVALLVIATYSALYYMSSSKTAVESRLLASLLIGTTLFLVLSGVDYWDHYYQILFCNEYKNGALNLYQVGEMIENYRFFNFITKVWEFSLDMIKLYGVLVYKGVVQGFVEGFEECVEIVRSYIKR